MFKKLFILLLIPFCLYSQDNKTKKKVEFDIGLVFSLNLYGNYLSNIKYPPQSGNYQFSGYKVIDDGRYLDFNIHLPSKYFSGLFYTLGGTILMNGDVPYFDDAHIHGYINGGGAYIGLLAEKMVVPWFGFYGSANIAYLAFEQKIHLLEDEELFPDNVTQTFIYTINDFGTRSGAGILFNINGLKIKSEFTFLTTGNNDNNAFVRSYGIEFRLGFGF